MTERRAVVLVGTPANPYSRGLRVARTLAGLGFTVEIAAVADGVAPELETSGPITIRRYKPSGPYARIGASYGTGGRLAAPPDRRLLARVLRVGRKVLATARRWVLWPHTVRGWWATLERELAPADLYHSCGVLPLAVALAARDRDRAAGRRSAVIYDAVDDVIHSSNLLGMPRPVHWWLARRERRWAQSADARLTINDDLAGQLATTWRTPEPPTVVMNFPERQPTATAAVGDLVSPPNRIRDALGLPASTRIVAFQGRIGPNRGLDEASEAILLVPDAALVLIGFGVDYEKSRARDADPRFTGRHFTLPAVHPDELLDWTASADVAVIPLPPISANERAATPNKFWEALAAGTPIVVRPGMTVMSELITTYDLGAVAESLSTADLAGAIQRVLRVDASEAAARRRRIAALAADQFTWPAAAERYVEVVRRILPS
jgi:glycosyltransferase involved in cell wall biosynthesis